MAFSPFKSLGHLINTQAHNLVSTVQDTADIFAGKKPTDEEKPPKPLGLFPTIASIIASPFVKEVTTTALHKSHSFLENAVFTAGIFAGSLIHPLLGVSAGLAIRHAQNLGTSRADRPLPQKAVATATTISGILIGTSLGPALIAGPLGIAIGAAAGGFASRWVGQNVTKFSNFLQTSFLGSRSLNVVNTTTDSIIRSVTNFGSPFTAFNYSLGCLGIVILTSLFFVIVAAGTLLISRGDYTSTPPSTPPITAISCFKFDDTWNLKEAAASRNLYERAIDTLVSQYPQYINIVCSKGEITLRYYPSNVDYCGITYGSLRIIDFASLSSCWTLNDWTAAFVLAHELGHIYQTTVDWRNSFLSEAYNIEGCITSYPECKSGNPYRPEESLPEAIAVYTAYKLYGQEVKLFNAYPLHMQYVEKYIGTIQ